VLFTLGSMITLDGNVTTLNQIDARQGYLIERNLGSEIESRCPI